MTDAHSRALAEFLRARRGRVRPSDVGLPTHGRRRVTGLRRDEVAMLAGISGEYYQRLEQGRDRHPSDQVVDGLARALQLEEAAVGHLRNLARPRPSRHRQRPPAPELHPSMQTLIDSWPMTPAHIYRSGAMGIVAANRLALAISPVFGPGHNSLRALFFEPSAPEFYREWPELTAQTVPYLRSLLGADRNDPEVIDLIEELSSKSEQFRRLWRRHDVLSRPSGLLLINHPVVGPLDLRYQQLRLPDTNHLLVAYSPEPGSPSEERLRALADSALGAVGSPN